MRFIRKKSFSFILLAFICSLAFIAAAPLSVEAGKTKTFYADIDTDGYGDPDSTVTGTKPPPGYVRNGDDCNDADPSINPAAAEICDDGIDQNCDGSDETCGGGTTYYEDADTDGYGNPDVSVTDTSPPPGYVSDDTDCDDADASINPGAEEVCDDGIDQNCNDEIDEGCTPPEPPANRLDWSLNYNQTVVQQNTAWQVFGVLIYKNGEIDRNDSRTQVTLSLAPGATGTLSGALTRTAQEGVVFFGGLSYDTVEIINIVATASNKKIASAQFGPVQVAASVSLVFDTQPASPQVVGEYWRPTFTVRTLADGVPPTVTDSGSLIYIDAAPGALGVLSGTLSSRTINGVATFGSSNNIHYSNPNPETITVRAMAWSPYFGQALSGPVSVKDSLHITSASLPDEGEIDVPIRPILSVTFTEPIDPATVTPVTYYLTGPTGTVPGSYVFSAGNTVVDLVLEGPLATGTGYTWTVTDGIADSYGFPLWATSFSQNFTTENAGWGPLKLIQQDFSHTDYHWVYHPDAAYSRNGQALVVYESSSHLFYRFYHETWISSSSVEKYNYWDLDRHGIPGTGYQNRFPSVGIDDTGNAIVTYVHWNAGILEVTAVTYDAATETWSTPTILGTVSDMNYDWPALAMNELGAAVVAWVEPVGASFQVQASHYFPATGWQPAQSVSALMSERPNAPYGEQIGLAINSWGQAAVAWNEQKAGDKSTYAAIFDSPALQWLAPVMLGQHSGAVDAQVGIDEAGFATCVFADVDGKLYASQFDGLSWDAPVSVSSGTAAKPDLSMVPGGDATLAYQQYDDVAQTWQTEARHFVNGLWEGSAQALGSPSIYGAVDTVVARDPNGNATVMYRTSTRYYKSRYVAGSGWQDVIGSLFSSGQDLVITMNPYGNAMAVLKHNDDGKAWRFSSGE